MTTERVVRACRQADELLLRTFNMDAFAQEIASVIAKASTEQIERIGRHIHQIESECFSFTHPIDNARSTRERNFRILKDARDTFGNYLATLQGLQEDRSN